MILDEIIANKRAELERLKADFQMEGLIKGLKMKIEKLQPALDFARPLAGDGINIIAEVKKASPSKGIIRKDFKPVDIAKMYEANGASAISVLTEEKYFHGHIDYLMQVRNAVSIPILRKDFIFDEYQIYEARAAGADAVLLIAAVLDRYKLEDMLVLIRCLGMACLVEVHNEKELEAVLATDAKLIGINNRDLNTFKTDIRTSIRLAGMIPKDRIAVSESGINSYNDIDLIKRSGINSFLVGEAIMREKDIGKKLRELKGIG